MKVQDVGRGPASVSCACIVLQTSPPEEDAILGVQPETPVPPYLDMLSCSSASFVARLLAPDDRRDCG